MKTLKTIHEYDLTLFNRLNSIRLNEDLMTLNRYISKTGDGHLYLLLLAWISLQDSIQNPVLLALLIGFAVERPVYYVLKNGFKRNRPGSVLDGFQSIIKPSDQFSFPSGHTSAAFMVAVLCGYFYPEVMPFLLGWAFLIGLSRIMLGVHFPTDTLMGMCLGVSTALISLEIILP